MGIDSLGIASVAAITVIAYIFGILCKAIDSIDDKWIPVIVGVVGAILGAVAFVTKMPDFPAEDIITGIAVGIVSGLSATGINQVFKQLSK